MARNSRPKGQVLDTSDDDELMSDDEVSPGHMTFSRKHTLFRVLDEDDIHNYYYYQIEQPCACIFIVTSGHETQELLISLEFPHQLRRPF
jgi:hypothetical protein